MMKKITVRLPIQVALVEVSGIRVSEEAHAFEGLTACADGYRELYLDQGITSVGGVEEVQAARQLFRALGIEPTRRRPSSEAMLNRVLKEKPLPQINTLVDVSNWCALDFLLPNGVYDAGKLQGDIELRKGSPGESYLALSNRDINLEDRYLLADELGAFGSPMTDSQRSAVESNTSHAVAVIYAPNDFDKAKLAEFGQIMAQRIEACCGGEVVQVTMVG